MSNQQSSYISSMTYGYKVAKSYNTYVKSVCWFCGEYIYHNKSSMKKATFSRVVHNHCIKLNKRRKRGGRGGSRYGEE